MQYNNSYFHKVWVFLFFFCALTFPASDTRPRLTIDTPGKILGKNLKDESATWRQRKANGVTI